MTTPDPVGAELQEALGSAYELQRELAGGGMSRVFLATERALNRDVVVKVLPPDGGETIVGLTCSGLR